MNFARNPPCCTLTYLVHGEGGAIPQELGDLQQLRHWEATVPGSFTLFNLFRTEIAAPLFFVSEIGWLVGVQPAIFLGDHPIGHRLRVGPRVNGRGSFASTF